MTGFAVGQIDRGHAFVLIEKLSQISGHSGLIVRVGHYQKDVGFETRVRLGCRRRLGRLCRERRREKCDYAKRVSKFHWPPVARLSWMVFRRMWNLGIGRLHILITCEYD